MDYTLEIVSKNEDSNDKAFKQYELNNIKTIGVEKSEPFAIKFTNHTYKDVQVRISIDGTDVLTGELASTNSDGRMWVVKKHSHMIVDAWPETNSGGARFVFGQEGDSVAKNTHGDMSAKGLIAAAVFVEGAVYTEWNWPYYTWPNLYIQPYKYGGCTTTTKTITTIGDNVKGGSVTTSSVSVGGVSASYSSSPAVGAGEYTQQSIVKTAGLSQPKFDQVIQLKYEWWDTLQKSLGKYEELPVTYDAFPGDKKMIDLKNTPRVKPLNKTASEIQRFV